MRSIFAPALIYPLSGMLMAPTALGVHPSGVAHEPAGANKPKTSQMLYHDTHDGKWPERRIGTLAKHTQHEVTVRFRDLDALGHVNYAVYLSYLEDALNRLWCEVLQAVGQRFDAQHPGIVSVRTEIDYRRSALYNQTLVVDVWVSKIGGSSFTTAYRIRDKETDKPLVEANTVQVVTIKGEEEGRMPKLVRSILETYSPEDCLREMRPSPSTQNAPRAPE